ncbi:CAP domain-containing protein [Rhizorhabdus dicambivorans]|uniref:SCP-like extracellular n=1 Tax=Rhizorhabdus dicambivorans TaxID=1850238 RepID=A0A2A4FVE2_9SPHN|nr:CAP domain-containing protein [Rhizorhabdus dicambivorans]ATE66985.1 SCP-like extracellular [Rhizorhabdus dicambivorans]PCE42141.1 SCP-like extracellular [Rhizorhabdus dicambivorans]
MSFGLGQTKVARIAGALALAFLSPLTQGATGIGNNLEDRLLAGHNRERASLGIPPLAWNELLERDARLYAQQLAQLGYLEHSVDEPNEVEPQGENLWAGTHGYYGPEQMVGLWIDEKKDFKAGIFPNNSLSGDLENVAHYTQVVWRSSRAVGCAVAHGKEDDFLVCRYSEGGNVIGEEPF